VTWFNFFRLLQHLDSAVSECWIHLLKSSEFIAAVPTRDVAKLKNLYVVLRLAEVCTLSVSHQLFIFFIMAVLISSGDFCYLHQCGGYAVCAVCLCVIRLCAGLLTK